MGLHRRRFDVEALNGIGVGSSTPQTDLFIVIDDGPMRMPNLVPDGDCDAVGTTAWTAVNDAILAKKTAVKYRGVSSLEVKNGVSPDGRADFYSNDLLTVDEADRDVYATWLWSCWARPSQGGVPRLLLDGEPVATGTDVNDWQYLQGEIVLAPGQTLSLECYGESGDYIRFDDVWIVPYKFALAGNLQGWSGADPYTDEFAPICDDGLYLFSHDRIIS